MKSIKALTVAMLFFATPSYVAARQPDLTDEDRTVVQVFEAPGSNKDEIFTASRMWIADHFKSAKAVIEYESKDDGVIIGNGNMAYPCSGGFACHIRAEAWHVGFTMKVEGKDGRFRLSFTNVHLELPPYSNVGLSLPARDEAVSRREDMDNIRAKLLEFGPQLVASIGKAESSNAW
ncbi:DUF4468 domain-containing protein [Cognatiluteimonas profundi]|uniref:DUF4468 domain-containing protein n=1 Tax=Cognatiluteimonas profundi TaxID=2594501 RepID=UPI00131E50BC|nr:DUF4468 domain-containing protein [Lysobacter profundi]